MLLQTATLVVAYRQLYPTAMDPRSTTMAAGGVSISSCFYFLSRLIVGQIRYALERTPTFIKIWFWPRSATNIPSDVLNGASSINTDTWGTPTAYFPNTQCDINSKFSPANIIINLTFCEFRFARQGSHTRLFISSKKLIL